MPGRVSRRAKSTTSRHMAPALRWASRSKVLAARSRAALREAAGQMAEYLRGGEDLSLHDIAYSAAMHRDIHLHRLAASAWDGARLAGALEEYAETATAEGITVGKY